ncbi:hypothetical protein KR093_002241 [Drosophila rubida]|uniref:J domain-containing protein n=1 Tax=Drosophila rubida TaxID=30044 RepID=A0AAD4JTR2_9MUSC|nr:hypothetical protein KR093_002241 [Drosophila rubida]
MLKYMQMNSLASLRYMATWGRPKYGNPMLSARKSYYDVLNVPTNSTLSEIKEAYIKLSKKYHPDVNSSTSDPEEFVKVCEAYKVLYKSASRAKYDYRLKTQFHADKSFTNLNVHNSWKKYQESMRSKQFGRKFPSFHGSSTVQKNAQGAKMHIINSTIMAIQQIVNSTIMVIPPAVEDIIDVNEDDVCITYPFNSSDYKWNLKCSYYFTGFSIVGALLATDWIKRRKRALGMLYL